MNNTFSILDKTSNNKYLTCPPRMDDGRHFTDYRPNYFINNMIRMPNNITSSYDYRQFLIHNAEKLMKDNRAYNEEKNCYGQKCDAIPIPFHKQCDINMVNSQCRVIDPNGVGILNVSNGKRV